MNNDGNGLTLGSLFDGSGGFCLGGLIAGIKPVWSSEIEPFPMRVTEKRLPSVVQLGNICDIDGGNIPPVDIITFGSPCQDMSIAGKREGLDGSRSGLFYEAIRIIKQMREKTDGRYPRFAVWENVKGAFSSNKGEDFRAVLTEFCHIKDECISVPGCEKWKSAGCILGESFSIAWRLLDAQYWGVPQRRERIYLVADLAGTGAGNILFESEGLSGYSAESFRSWQTAAGSLKDSAGETDSIRLMFENNMQDVRYTGPIDVAPSILARYGTGGNTQPFVVQPPLTLKIRSGCEGGGKGALVQNNKSATLGTHNDQTLFQPMAFGICAKGSNAMLSDNPKSGFYEADTSRCLDANGGNPSCNQGGIAVIAIEGNGCRPSHNGDGFKESDVMYTLNTIEHHAVAQPSNPYHGNKASYFMNFSDDDAVGALVATDYKDPPAVMEEPYYIVRRLTPVECARLQGFPDWWCDGLASVDPSEEEVERWMGVFETYSKVMGTKPKTENQVIKWLKDPYSDSAAYKMWGNGVALPNVFFVLSGIVYYSQFQPELL